jgi:tetraacyldisaccharide 4'-kinase
MTFIKKVLSGADKRPWATVLRGMAWLASKPYSRVIAMRNIAYDKGWLKSTKLDIPVISIGNLTVGGTGKTPAVALVCRYLRSKGVRVAVVSRGYGAGDSGFNDEAMELELQLPDVPHVQNPDRVAAAILAHDELDSQLIVMDDGFQHRRLRRDLEIVLLDATEPFGYGHLLPRGLLRESIGSLRRADVVIATRANQVDDQKLADIRTRMQRYAPTAVWAEAIHRPRHLRDCNLNRTPLTEIEGKRCLIFSGIGNPTAFKQTVQGIDAQVEKHIEFADHHAYMPADIARLEEVVSNLKAQYPSEPIFVICTGKDLSKVNLLQLAGAPLYALDIEMELRFGSDAFHDRLDKIIQMATVTMSNSYSE